jgi:hypothetical protein
VSFGHKGRTHGILFDVSPNAVELFGGSYQMIVAFVLPKGLALPAEQLVGKVSGEPLQRSQPSRRNDMGCNQKVNVIRHYDEGVKLVSIKSAISIVQSPRHDFGDFPLAQIQRTADPAVQEAIHGYECLPRLGHGFRREHSMPRKTAVQAESDEQWLIDSVPVREASFVMPHPIQRVSLDGNFSEKSP